MNAFFLSHPGSHGKDIGHWVLRQLEPGAQLSIWSGLLGPWTLTVGPHMYIIPGTLVVKNTLEANFSGPTALKTRWLHFFTGHIETKSAKQIDMCREIKSDTTQFSSDEWKWWSFFAILNCDPVQSVQCKLGMSESGEGAVECRGGEEISGLTTTSGCLMHCPCNTAILPMQYCNTSHHAILKVEQCTVHAILCEQCIVLPWGQFGTMLDLGAS